MDISGICLSCVGLESLGTSKVEDFGSDEK